MVFTLTARWIFPVSGPPLERGTITIDGERIVAVEPHGRRTPDEDCGNAAIIPGLVNAHTHLDLSGARGQLPPTDADHFPDWLRQVIAYRRTRTPQQVAADIRAGLAECLRFGTTLVGDISADGTAWPILSAAPVRAVVFRELLGLTDERAWHAWATADEWLRHHPPTATCRPGLSPHAPYSARATLFDWVARTPLVATHLAESPAEMELLRFHRGPLVAFLQELGVWDADGLTTWEKLLTEPPSAGRYLFAHANYLPLAWAERFTHRHSIVYCPRTHAAFRHPPHPFRQWCARGVRVCLGTDSLASNPDLDLLAEARWVRQSYPDCPGELVLRMATLAGAQALGWADACGSLEVGKSADLVVVPLPNADAADPHELLLRAEGAAERRTLFRGVWR
ncbi:MAG: amidohydrolase family protein [Gemmataceae bacterium]|nr:amidohydrolase family protein [Gemmata sp.]MDW8198094.1 amidohydrolase family protein [Gemmataceae bacterium]